MKELLIKNDVGIIIGRFCTHELTEGHKDLIDSVRARHNRVIIFLGSSTLRNTKNYPIDLKHRAAMIRETYPDVDIGSIPDNRSNEAWSKQLDKEIGALLMPGQTCTLYGSRDSFIRAYSGKNHTCELEAEINVSASQIRKEIMINYPSSVDYRAGLIAATGMHYPIAYQTVDVAILDLPKNRMLLAKKPGETKWRFVGGFSDPRSNSLEDDAKREVQEETGLEVANIQYIGSTSINDWRYRSEQDKIKTAFFAADYVFGGAIADDDIEEVKWFSLDNITENDIVDEHHVLFDMLIHKLQLQKA